MEHHTPLIATVVIGLSLAFFLGAIAQRLKVSPIAGYLLAGIAVGPYTPGFVADQALALELAEIGVILLMFGVGLHFSLSDLMSVRAIAIPGAIVQIAVATLMGLGLAAFQGWPFASGLVFGLALSVASTVVLLRALQERRLVNTERGRIAVGWLIVEDIVMVLALVLLPVLTPGLKGETAATVNLAELAGQTALTLGKVGAFVAIMLLIGRRLIPAVLHYIAHTGSRELFRLGVLAIALGVAYGAANVFGVSFALGAFFAGMILSESQLSQRAAKESLPLRDAFAVLFFISVGMLFNPSILVAETWAVALTTAIIVFGKSLAALAIVLAFRHSMATALFISASLAQIGEFSFILAGLGGALGVLSDEGRDLILAAALISILLNPLLFLLLDQLTPWLEQRTPRHSSPADSVTEKRQQIAATTLAGHVVLIGYGRVGKLVAGQLMAAGQPFVVIDERDEAIETVVGSGLQGIAARAPAALPFANLPKARTLIIAIPDVFEAGQIVEQARLLNGTLAIIAQVHSDAEGEHLMRCGANSVVLGSKEIAHALVEKVRDRPPEDHERQRN